MTLEEAIKHYEEVAEEYEQKLKDNPNAICYRSEFFECAECAKEHRQLVEWLRELKSYKEQQPSEDCVKREDVKSGMIKYGFLAPDMTVTEFVEDCLPSVTPQIEPSADCISREEVRRILGNEVFELMKLHTVNPEDNPKADAMSYGVNWSLNTLMELPSVTPQIPKGKWIHWTDDYKDYCTCSECGYGEEGEVLLKDKTPYCPYCGAEMIFVV